MRLAQWSGIHEAVSSPIRCAVPFDTRRGCCLRAVETPLVEPAGTAKLIAPGRRALRCLPERRPSTPVHVATSSADVHSGCPLEEGHSLIAATQTRETPSVPKEGLFLPRTLLEQN